ncbi:hypothetical protein KJN74_02715 [Candidatus Bathyarchaeota archaeon]|nr:hypothetical protein [Candidatus Bathyarchaeota archaeon]
MEAGRLGGELALMRTVEVLFVIIILLTSFGIATQFAVLPSPRQAYGTDLGELAQSTLETLDVKGVLSATVFDDISDDSWGSLQTALSASLPVNVVYNLSVYEVSENSGVITYHISNSVSDVDFAEDSDSASLLVTSPDVTYSQDSEKVGEHTGQALTLYILNCSDANGWWITGFTGQGLATEFYDILSPYFETTVLINTTDQLGLLLDGTLSEGDIQNAVVVNTFGESVPIPSDYCQGGAHQSKGYGASGSYSKYFYTLGGLTREYNWTWVSIVGYPFYYVTNTINPNISSYDNGYGIYGMRQVGSAGVNAFLQGLDNSSYSHDSSGTASGVGVVQFTPEALESCNYYGIYPSPYQTASRALTQSIKSTYNLDQFGTIFELKSDRIAGATFRHQNGSGALTALGLTRIPDIRIAALGLLLYYQPKIYRTEFGASGMSRFVTLQLGQQGGT